MGAGSEVVGAGSEDGGGVDVVVEGAGVGSDDGGGVDVVVVVEVDPPPEVVVPLAPSDIHQPPLSLIQWYPEGQEPEEVPEEVVVPEDPEDDVDCLQVQAAESKYQPLPQLDAETL